MSRCGVYFFPIIWGAFVADICVWGKSKVAIPSRPPAPRLSGHTNLPPPPRSPPSNVHLHFHCPNQAWHPLLATENKAKCASAPPPPQIQYSDHQRAQAWEGGKFGKVADWEGGWGQICFPWCLIPKMARQKVFGRSLLSDLSFRWSGVCFVCLAQTWENGGVSSWVANKVAKSSLCFSACFVRSKS